MGINLNKTILVLSLHVSCTIKMNNVNVKLNSLPFLHGTATIVWNSDLCFGTVTLPKMIISFYYKYFKPVN